MFERARKTTVVCFGKEIGPHLAEVLDARPAGTFSAKWGNQFIDTYRFGPNGEMLVLPHLPSYKLFSRAISATAFQCALLGKEEPAASAATSPGRTPRSARHQPNDVLHLIVTGNPKMSNRKSILRFDCYRNCMTVAEYKTAVRQRLGTEEAAKCGPELNWDTEHNFIWIERR